MKFHVALTFVNFTTRFRTIVAEVVVTYICKNFDLSSSIDSLIIAIKLKLTDFVKLPSCSN